MKGARGRAGSTKKRGFKSSSIVEESKDLGHTHPMIYEQAAESEDLETLSVRSARRKVELAAVAVTCGIGTVLVRGSSVIPERAQAVFLGLGAIGAVLLGGPLLFLWFRPPSIMRKREMEWMAAYRAADKPVKVLSRAYLALVGLLCLGFCYWFAGKLLQSL